MHVEIITPGPPQGSIHVQIVALTINCLANGIKVGVQNPRGSDLCAVRQEGLDRALAQNPTHILWIDSDQVFPPDLAVRLLAHNVPAVACTVMIKDFRGNHNAYDLNTRKPIEPSTGLVRYDNLGIGFGIFMHEVGVIPQLEWPYFGQKWVIWNDQPLSTYEDEWFCRRMKAAGIPIHIDHDLSAEVGHYGSVVFRQQGVTLG